ncbi:MAG: hypothetical protein UH249_00280 [Acutalibacteraceae bacterium]|nr:hypothetical protein [Acutalibacteraceae bacterium]
MKKVLIIGILVVAVLAAGFTAGYFVKNQDTADSTAGSEKGTTASTESSTDDAVADIDVEKIYNDFLASAEAEKYYHLLEDDEDEGFKYSGKKEVEFFDIDNDGVNECFVRVEYHYDDGIETPQSNSEEQICIFDIDGDNVHFVKSTGLCAPYRVGEKLRLIKTEDGTYKIFWYICEANKIREGSVYSYDGKALKLEKSFFADIYPIIYDEKTFFISSTSDLFDETSEIYANYEAAEKITEDAFYEQWNYYESGAECAYQAPEQSE